MYRFETFQRKALIKSSLPAPRNERKISNWHKRHPPIGRGILAGTGSMGGALVKQLASAGLSVILGSRDAAKAKATAAEVSEAIKKPVKGLKLDEAAAAGDVIFWTVSGPLADREALLKTLAEPLRGKIIIDTTNILNLLDESAWGQVSSTLLNEKALGVPARWTTAFKATFSQLLRDPPPASNPHSIFVAGDDEEAVDITIALVDTIPGFKGTKAGPLKNSKIIELLGPKWMPEVVKLNAWQTFRSGWRLSD
ncbi:unnamed protein product [Calypogeia fissa]